jgi:23S rRNA (cytosine1962-C5)-methyltransferase
MMDNLSTQNLVPALWAEYSLLDAGNGEKLEQFGPYVVRRPEPQAIWKPAYPDIWHKAHAVFAREKGSQEKGTWQYPANQADRWWVTYPLPEGGPKISLKVSLSSFKHVGIFPEQAPNWDFIYLKTKALDKPNVLNLFAYTGGATLAAAAAGATVTHVEAMKPTLSWANENAKQCNLDQIRWMADDALAFTKREARRGKKYQGIILDPPAYGRGPNGEKWLLEECIQPLLEATAELLDPEHGFVILNLYSLGYSPLIAQNLAKLELGPKLPSGVQEEFGELCVGGGQVALLPLGTYWRAAW